MKDGKHIEENGEVWFQNGKRHRDGGPAWTWTDGSEFWYQNGQLHRDDGPAAIWADGAEGWWNRDKIHRIDGPAVIWADGTQHWYQNGDKLSKEEVDIIKDSIKFDEMIRELCTE